MLEFLQNDPLSAVYAALLAVSLLFVVLSLLGADATDALDLDVDLDIDSDGLDVPSVSGFAIASFLASFGAIGLVTKVGMGRAAVPSALSALIAGVVLGVGAQALFIYVLSPTKSSHFSLADDAIGRRADVIVSIPEGGVGKIAFDNPSGRVTLGARSTSKEPIRSGQAVIVEKVVGRVAHFHPLGRELFDHLTD